MGAITTADVQDRTGKAAEHLQSLRSLATELERAMRAISSNDLSNLEDSVANQQVLSTRLEELTSDLCIPLEAHHQTSQARLDDDLMSQIRAASETLQKLNRRYAALLKQSSRSVALMASLFTSFQGQLFQGQFQEASGPRLKHQTWSCRM
jgi:hypothetical protein